VGANTRIPWCDHTFNPFWGCIAVSPGCKNCYADAFDRRLGGNHWAPGGPIRTFGDKHWAAPRRWDQTAAKNELRYRVFCGSMCDVFLRGRDDTLMSLRMRLWNLIEATPNLDWLLLTKRIENYEEMVPIPWQVRSCRLPNVWLGVTVENQEFADKRIPLLLQAPWPTVRFVSCEPLLGYIALPRLPELDWVIVGAESGRHARPMNENWVREIRDECVSARVPFFYKQRLENGRKIEMPELDGRTWAEVPETC
jgi:protein gp37